MATIIPNVIEGLSFKLCLDFLKYLNKNKIYSTNIKVSFYNNRKQRNVFKNYQNILIMEEFFKEEYFSKPKNCSGGKLVSIQSFRCNSDTYNFDTGYRVIDVSTSLYKLISLSSFDRERNPNRKIFKERQIKFINNTVLEYLKFFNEIQRVYKTGIYSYCYAEPGWSENTWWLGQLNKFIIQENNKFKFPYNMDLSLKNPNN